MSNQIYYGMERFWFAKNIFRVDENSFRKFLIIDTFMKCKESTLGIIQLLRSFSFYSWFD